jgi:hypothetical protein
MYVYAPFNSFHKNETPAKCQKMTLTGHRKLSGMRDGVEQPRRNVLLLRAMNNANPVKCGRFGRPFPFLLFFSLLCVC